MEIKKQLLILSFAFLIIPFPSEGAVLYFSPSESRHSQGDVFKADIILDSQGDSINAGQFDIFFNKDVFEVIDTSKGGSFLTLWPKNPFYSNQDGLLVAAGGVPGGFKGEGKVFSIVFRAIGTGTGTVSFKEGSKIFLNDGNGTAVSLVKKDAVFEVSSGSNGEHSDQWEKEIEQDKERPEPFEIEIGRDPSVFDNRYFISFSAEDKETGVAFYQVREGDSDWKRADSPYLLENQALSEKISVRAVDKAGNERIENIHPERNSLFYAGVISILIFILLIAYFIFKRLIFKKNCEAD